MTTQRNSYTLASKAANHPLMRINSVISELSHTNARLATQLAIVVVSIEHDSVKESDIVKLDTLASDTLADEHYSAILDLRDLALTIVGAHAYADKVLPLMKKIYPEVTDVVFQRTSTSKTAKYEVVATVNGKYAVHMTVNTTAALDMRKVLRDYGKKRANALARAEKRKQQDAARAEKRKQQQQKRASKREQNEQKRQLRMMLNDLTPEQQQQLINMVLAA